MRHRAPKPKPETPSDGIRLGAGGVAGPKAVKDGSFCRCGHRGSRHFNTAETTRCGVPGCGCEAFGTDVYRHPPDASWMSHASSRHTQSGRRLHG